jgi:phytoene synthase
VNATARPQNSLQTKTDAATLARAYEFCLGITKKHAKSFYFSARFLKPEKRLPIYALYALCRLVDDEVDAAEVNDEPAAIAAVENWKKKLEEVYSKTENVKLKPENGQALVLLAWRDMLSRYKIPQELPLELMRGVLMDTHIKRYETWDELYVYCYRVASTVGLMSSEIFGYEKPETLEYAEALGIAMQLTNILRDVREDSGLNRIYLPQEDLKRFNVSEEQILATEFDNNFTALMKFEIERARYYYHEAERGIPLLEKDVRFTVLLAARIYGKILDEIERQNYDVFSRRAHTTKTQKISIIPRTWLTARKM